MATHKSSKTFFFMCSGTKKASIFFSPCLEASASGNKKYHTEKHQIGFSLRVREQKGSHTRASIFSPRLGTKRITRKSSKSFSLCVWKQKQHQFFSPCLEASASGNKKYHTEKHQIGVSLRVREQKGSHTRASFFFSASGNKKDHTQEQQKFFSMCLGTKNGINFFLRVREQKGSHTRASIFFSTSGNKKDHTQEAAKDFSDFVSKFFFYKTDRESNPSRLVPRQDHEPPTYPEDAT